MMGYNKSKFKFSETFNNKDGKTSGSGFIGVITGLVGTFLIFAGVFAFFFKYPEALGFLGLGLKVILISASLMGVRKVGGQFADAKGGKDPDPDDPTPLDEKG
jgi:hypothetical protein